MPDEEEARLLAVLKGCLWSSRVASDALTRPMHSVIIGGAAHRKLMEAEATARVNHAAALLAWRAYKRAEDDTATKKSRGSGGNA
jgi:hypothetical protein